MHTFIFYLTDNTFVLFPEESAISPQIGYINQIGINKIKTNQYISNTVEIKLEVVSKEIDSKKFKYTTYLHVKVDINGTQPNFQLIQHSII